jgi:hypothetical protein
MRYLIATLHTITGAFAGAAITLGIVGQLILDPGSTLSARLAVVVLMLAGASVVCATALIIIQRPRRNEHLHT